MLDQVAGSQQRLNDILPQAKRPSPPCGFRPKGSKVAFCSGAFSFDHIGLISVDAHRAPLSISLAGFGCYSEDYRAVGIEQSITAPDSLRRCGVESLAAHKSKRKLHRLTSLSLRLETVPGEKTEALTAGPEHSARQVCFPAWKGSVSLNTALGSTQRIKRNSVKPGDTGQGRISFSSNPFHHQREILWAGEWRKCLTSL
jgi:hypothetical protein